MEAALGSEGASLGKRGRREVFAGRMLVCVDRAFEAVGTGPIMKDYVFWSLSLDVDDIVDRPERLMDALREVRGEAWAAVYEYKLVREVMKEFELLRTGVRGLTGEKEPGRILRAAMTAAWRTL
jgi:hypothetical protein